jgi:hypothetical protein
MPHFSLAAGHRKTRMNQFPIFCILNVSTITPPLLEELAVFDGEEQQQQQQPLHGVTDVEEYAAKKEKFEKQARGAMATVTEDMEGRFDSFKPLYWTLGRR